MNPPFVFATIVEGHGEVIAVPLLLRRLAAQVAPARAVEVPKPIRVNRAGLLKDGGLERYVQLAALNVGSADGAIVVLIDADDDCPAQLAPKLVERAQAARPDAQVSIVLAKREFEAWFLASAASLRGRRGLPDDLEPPEDAEGPRDAKGWLQRRRTDGYAYSPTTDQPALAQAMSLPEARAGSPSFDKLWRKVEGHLAGSES